MADEIDKKLPPIIIKKIKKVQGGHHGGAWKVAYADFVTAMMAFFMLMWLISVITPAQKQGVAQYFTPTVGLKDSLGIGFQGGLSPEEDGTAKGQRGHAGIVAGEVPKGPLSTQDDSSVVPEDEDTDIGNNSDSQISDKAKKKVEGDDGDSNDEQEKKTFKEIEEKLLNAMEETPELKQMKDNIIISHTPEGLKIDLVDDPYRPMYVPGTANMTESGRKVLRTIGKIVRRATNHVAIAGHTEASNFRAGATYTNWELTSDRAASARRFMSGSVLEKSRINRISGKADSDPLLTDQPKSVRNRRISLTLLKGAHMKVYGDTNSRGLISVPDVGLDAIRPKEDTRTSQPQPDKEVKESELFDAERVNNLQKSKN